MDDSLWIRVRERWANDRMGARPPATEREILDTEQRLGRVLPYDLRAYFAVTGGMEPNEMDSLYFRFWMVDEVTFVTEESPNVAGGSEYLLFADFLLWSHGYAVRCVEPYDVVLVGYSEMIPVAATFRDFWSQYLERPDTLYG